MGKPVANNRERKRQGVRIAYIKTIWDIDFQSLDALIRF